MLGLQKEATSAFRRKERFLRFCCKKLVLLRSRKNATKTLLFRSGRGRSVTFLQVVLTILHCAAVCVKQGIVAVCGLLQIWKL